MPSRPSPAHRDACAVAESENQKAQARVAHLQSFVDRFRAKASKAKQAQSRLKMIRQDHPHRHRQQVNAGAARLATFPEPEELSAPQRLSRSV